MTRIVTGNLGIVLTIALAVGMILSSNSRIVSHDVTELAQTINDYSAGIEDHGHAHDEIVSIIDAYHGHAHDVADHDHNVAFLPPRLSSTIAQSTPTNWLMYDPASPNRRNFDLDRPPRA